MLFIEQIPTHTSKEIADDCYFQISFQARLSPTEREAASCLKENQTWTAPDAGV